jgi:predicted CXXCH cytochrome family protein
MRTRWLGILAVLSTVAPAAALAVDAPHDGSFTVGTCENCHMIHNAVGGTLLNQPDNNTACTACHNPLSTTPSGARLGLPWITEDQAFPGKSGQQHRWDALAATPAFGAKAPTDTEMLKRIKDGRIQCAACHDPHADVKAFDPTALHTSIAPGVATAQSSTPAVGSLMMTLTAPAAAAVTKGYRVQVLRTAGTSPNFTFELGISHDAKTTAPTWLNYSTSWVAGTSAGLGTKFWATGSVIALDDPAVVVTFTGTPAVGQFWDFYVSYAHLRANNVADAMCLQCHGDRNQTHTTVGGTGNGTFIFSHPIGEALNANGGGYDRASANVLDANGLTQTAGDGNPTNDLTLDGTGKVQCTTCHNVHNADSNSLTTDAR